MHLRRRGCQINFSIRAFAFPDWKIFYGVLKNNNPVIVMSKAKKAEEEKKKKVYYKKKEKKAKEVKK
jgi:hypothetical protein